MRCEYLAYKVAQAWRISIQRGWESSSGKLFPGLLSLLCCCFGCSWTVSMHPISQRSHLWALNWRPTRHTALDMNPCAWKGKMMHTTGFFSMHLDVLHIPPAVGKLWLKCSTQLEPRGQDARGGICTRKWDVPGNPWSFVPSLCAMVVGWSNTFCSPTPEHGGHTQTTHWKLFSVNVNQTISGIPLGKLCLTWTQTRPLWQLGSTDSSGPDGKWCSMAHICTANTLPPCPRNGGLLCTA